MDDYEFRPGGSLKLKGAVSEGGVTKKKKKSSSSKLKAKVDKEREQRSAPQEAPPSSDKDRLGTSPLGSARESPAVEEASVQDDKKTDAERRFERVQRERLEKRVAKLATKTHKERVHEFNSKLEALSEHHDIPKVGPG